MCCLLMTILSVVRYEQVLLTILCCDMSHLIMATLWLNMSCMLVTILWFDMVVL